MLTQALIWNLATCKTLKKQIKWNRNNLGDIYYKITRLHFSQFISYKVGGARNDPVFDLVLNIQQCNER
jgi:hypothetical protein